MQISNHRPTKITNLADEYDVVGLIAVVFEDAMQLGDVLDVFDASLQHRKQQQTTNPK